MLYRSRLSNVPTSSLQTQTLLLYSSHIWTHHSTTCVSPAIAIYDRIRVQFSLRKLKSGCSFSLSCTYRKPINYFHTGSSRCTGQLNFRRSPLYLPSPASASRFYSLNGWRFSLPSLPSSPAQPLLSLPSSSTSWLPVQKKGLIFQEQLSHPSQADPLPPGSASLFTKFPARARGRRARGRARASTSKNSPPAALSRRPAHASFLGGSALSLCSSLHPSLGQNAVSSPAFSRLHKTSSASTPRAPLCQLVFQRNADYDSHFNSLQKN